MANMNRVVVFGAVGTLSLMSLIGCSNTPQASTAESPAMTASEPASASKAADYQPLFDVVSKTKAAVEAGDFESAQAEFNKFEDSWRVVEDGIKDRSPDTYDAIEENMDALTGALKASDSEKALAALQSLETSIQSAAK